MKTVEPSRDRMAVAIRPRSRPNPRLRCALPRASRPRTAINDAHCHFFSTRFLELLSPDMGKADDVAAQLQWDPPGTATELGDRWVAELDRHGVSRAALIASIPGDERRSLEPWRTASTPLRRVLHTITRPVSTPMRRSNGRSRTSRCGPSACFRPCTAIGWMTSASSACSAPPPTHGDTVFVRGAADRRPQEARAAEPLRLQARRSAHARPHGARLPAGPGDRAALRRGVLSRSPDGRRPVPDDPPRYTPARTAGSGSTAVRHSKGR